MEGVVKNYIDGPGFVEWLLEEKPETMGAARKLSGKQQGTTSSLGRRSLDWQKGARVTVDAADRYLIEIGLSLSMVPEDLYRDHPLKVPV